ncbi:MAG TPA: hypothetical protein VHF58_00145 [Solirubrobacterales bacterium]|nr:hypothetical protein [Solirubrobacterales bacterium]
MTQISPLPLRPEADVDVEPGDYFSTERELYRVERVVGDRVLLEDCRTEALIEVGVDQVLGMKPVNRSH